ncbi:E3 ubiquitin-protein ligase UPL5 [Morella rubra]|uniref:HECT-type E3 ubiquitin transferase n=1 Tax=Morella rubra TaxID=262757 RepID=A0A6A1VSQ7_9ROSI|nr:E3 ubiquitin-protein ligase UPL5 [Morella rubra]KAB1214967.1 E3 ubiquitin-protein ligase UPL5 [Morella rubra]
MSLVQTPNVDCVPQRGGPTTTTTTNAIIPTVDHPRLSSKRKLDDYGGPAFEDEDDENDAVFTELVSVRMRKDEPNAVHCSSDAQSLAVVTTAATEQFSPRVPDARSASYACSTRAGSTRSESRLQFFIRTIPDGKTRVIQAYSHDTVRSVHEKIQLVTGIPVHEQRLIYRGKQLQWERSLAECSIQNDAGLQLVGRMRSTEHPHAWQVVDDIVSVVCRLCRGETISTAAKHIKLRMTDFLTETPKDEERGPGHLQIFLSCSAPAALVMLYMSPTIASKVDPLHLEYFCFSGRVIALALMHKVQVGIVFDRVFFLQLAGKFISLEDIRDADPCLYSSCKLILEMDPDYIDSDALGLTFVREVEELGSRRVVELCPGGKSIVVNSKNREDYVKLLIQHQFVTSISEQVSHFAQGFGHILCNSRLQKFFFQSLELEDLDWMLYGSETAICIDDWKAHTEYNGYIETDPQIFWFWKIVGGMSAEQRKILLSFWTSLQYLPVEGFRGLASRLYIYKSSESHDRLPSSHTCFYRLCFPPYPSMAMMEERLLVIAQEHVGCSFGTW